MQEFNDTWKTGNQQLWGKNDDDWIVDDENLSPNRQVEDDWNVEPTNPDGNLLKEAPGCLLYNPQTNEFKALHPFKPQAKVIEDEIIDMSFLDNWPRTPLTEDQGVLKYSNPELLMTPRAPDQDNSNPSEDSDLLPEPLARVRIRYEGRKESGELLDKLRDRKQLKAFKLHADDMLPGIHLAAGSLKKGESAWFKFEPDYHYGKSGVPQLVGPNAVLYYKVELVDFTNQKKTLENDDYDGRIELLAEARDKGNAAFAEKDYDRALSMYKRGTETIRNLPKVLLAILNEDQKREMKDFQIKFGNNAVLTCLKKQEYKEGLSYADLVLSVEPTNTKALFRKGQCLMELKELDDALECFKESWKNEEGEKSEIERHIEVCKKRIEHKLKNDKKRYQHVFQTMSLDEEKEKQEKMKMEKIQRKMEREELAKLHDPILNGQGVKKIKTENAGN